MKKQNAFIWNELITQDPQTSGDFYSKLFDWDKKEVNAGPFGIYTIFQQGGEDVAGMMNPTIDYTRKLGARWYAYVAVDNIDTYVDRAKKLGGTILAGPDDIPGVGRVCFLADPTGAHIRIVQPIQKQQSM